MRATITRPVVDDKKSHVLFSGFSFLGKTACLEAVLLETELTAIEYDCYPFFDLKPAIAYDPHAIKIFS